MLRCVLSFSLCFVGWSAAAQQILTPKSEFDSCVEWESGGRNIKDIPAAERKQIGRLCRAKSNANERFEKRCDSSYEQLSETREDAMEMCSGYGAGGLAACIQKVDKCTPDDSAEGSGSSISSILGAIGMPSLNAFSQQRGCPQFTSEKIEDQIEQIEEQLTTSKDNIEELQNTIQEQQEGLQKMQAEVDGKRIGAEHDIMEMEINAMAEQREIAANAVTERHQLERQIDRAHEEMMKAQSQIARAIQEKNKQLLSLKRSCDSVYDGEKAAIEQEIAAMRQSGRKFQGGMGASGKMKVYYEQRLRRVYSRCLDRAREDRKMVINASSEQMRIARQQQRRAQNEMDRIRDEIAVRRSRASQEVAEKQTRSLAFREHKQKEVNATFNRLQQAQMQASQVQAQIQQKLQAEQQSQMMTNLQLASLKAQKPSVPITKTYHQARGAIDDFSSAANGFVKTCCPKKARRSTASADGEEETYRDSRCDQVESLAQKSSDLMEQFADSSDAIQ